MQDGRCCRSAWAFTLTVSLAFLVMAMPAGWSSASAPPVLVHDNEELFTPYLVASLLPAERDLGMSRQSKPPVLADVGDSLPSLAVIGARLVKRGEYATAVTVLESQRYGQNFLALHALGVAYVRLHRNAEAYEILVRAHRLNPSIAGPLLPAALACARMASRCDEYRQLAFEYVALGGKFKKLADKIANHQPITLAFPKRS
jgi:hypothetical protein